MLPEHRERDADPHQINSAREPAVIHPMQYELEQAHHANCERRAVRQRFVAEAERLAANVSPAVRVRAARSAIVERPAPWTL